MCPGIPDNNAYLSPSPSVLDASLFQHSSDFYSTFSCRRQALERAGALAQARDNEDESVPTWRHLVEDVVGEWPPKVSGHQHPTWQYHLK